VIGVLVVLSVLFLYSRRANIIQKAMPKAIEKAMTSSVFEELGEGLHLALCGAGSPLPDPKRSGSCVAVAAGEKLFVVDAGTGGARNLTRMGYPLGEIEALFLTHFHSDHIEEGVTEVVEGFNRAYAPDAVYRNDHHGDGVAPLSGAGMEPMGIAIPDGGESLVVYDQGGLKVEVIAVEHRPVSPSVAYLFTYQGRTILVSGDTVKNPDIEKFAKGVDLLVHEALSRKMVGIMNAAAKKTGNEITARITADILDYHTTPVEAAEIARDAGVGHLLYYPHRSAAYRAGGGSPVAGRCDGSGRGVQPRLCPRRRLPQRPPW
jgi:ribonuclease Z